MFAIYTIFYYTNGGRLVIKHISFIKNIRQNGLDTIYAELLTNTVFSILQRFTTQYCITFEMDSPCDENKLPVSELG